jgi:hypothetical protein
MSDRLPAPVTSAGPARERALALLLRCLGLLDLCAVLVIVAPRGWIDGAHQAVGLGPFPVEPIALYLARSTSALYALHGALIVYLSFDVARQARLIRFLALAALVHGAVILAIDIPLDLPTWWKLVEGPAFSATGLAVLLMQHRAGLRQ